MYYRSVACVENTSTVCSAIKHYLAAHFLFAFVLSSVALYINKYYMQQNVVASIY